MFHQTEEIVKLKQEAIRAVLIAAGTIGAFVAANARGAAPGATSSKPTEDPIRQQIESKEPQQVQQAVEAIWEQLHSADPRAVRNAVRGLIYQHWLDGLMALNRHDDVEKLSLEGMKATASEVKWVEALEKFRIKSFLKAGKPNEALSAAKELFNVCPMESTAGAVSLIVDCLKAAYSSDTEIIDRFANEQVAGAGEESTQPSAVSNQRSVLGSIKTNRAFYDKAAQEYDQDEFWNLMSRGNLLLLADRAKEARPVFERAYAIAPEKHLAAATESIARCLKAEDGAIGRANAWVLSIRP
jgi:tetratricopeptide (TPR) repeat protein